MLTNKKSDDLEAIGYADTDLVECVDSKRSTSRLCLHTSGMSHYMEKLQTIHNDSIDGAWRSSKESCMVK